jgi:hypothetical protein
MQAGGRVSEFDRTDPLMTALEELAELGGPDDRAALDRVRDRLRERRLRVLIAGEAKRGKSTLVNALADNTSEPEAALDTMDAAVLVLSRLAGACERARADDPGRGPVGHHVCGPQQGGLPRSLTGNSAQVTACCDTP